MPGINRNTQAPVVGVPDPLADLLARATGQSSINEHKGRGWQPTPQLDRAQSLGPLLSGVLSAGRDRWNATQPLIDQRQLELRAAGKRFLQPSTQTGANGLPKYSFEEDRGVAQGNFDYALARAQKRTPLQDSLRARAMAALMMGG